MAVGTTLPPCTFLLLSWRSQCYSSPETPGSREVEFHKTIKEIIRRTNIVKVLLSTNQYIGDETLQLLTAHLQLFLSNWFQEFVI